MGRAGPSQKKKTSNIVVFLVYLFYGFVIFLYCGNTNLVLKYPVFPRNVANIYIYIYIYIYICLKKNMFWTFFLYIYIKKTFEVSKMFSHGFFKHNKKFIFLHFWILQHVCKTPKGIQLLFTVNVWIKKSQRDEYPKY